MRLLLLLVFSAVLQTAIGQNGFGLALEAQVYPTGIIPGVTAEWQLNDRHAVHARVGYNIVDHRDLGVQDNEEGGGFGFSVGYRYTLGASRRWTFGARSDLWFNSIDWRDDLDNGMSETGLTEVKVLQPTAELAHRFPLGDGGFYVAPSVAFGAEINIKTEGREVGQGAILLLGVSIGKRF